MEIVFLGFLILAAAVVFTAYFSNIIANRAHNRRTWWHRRADAYTNLIEALSDIVDYAKWHEGEASNEYVMSESRMNEISQARKASILRLRRAADSGQFLFSDEVVTALQQFQRDAASNQVDAADKCLRVVIGCSVRDLRLKN